MKNLILLTGLIVIFLASSCTKDEDLIIGTWLASSYINTNCKNTADNQNLTFTNGCSKQVTDGVEFDICMKMTFTESGTYILETKFTFFGQTETETDNGTYIITDGKIKICDDKGDCDDNTFSVDKKSLYFYGTDADTGCKTEFRFVK
ncbi:MAG: hypothetical protein IPH57_01100 [Saprospiraceae bacterium]|nr:hypothetical protein [Saprospiraceae bacterium]